MFLRVSRFVSIAAIFALCVIHNVRPVFAQVSGATLSGVVHDESQTPVGKAKVVVKNVATGVSRELTTKADGSYATSNLLPGILRGYRFRCRFFDRSSERY